jgi:hypothetical protein
MQEFLRVLLARDGRGSGLIYFSPFAFNGLAGYRVLMVGAIGTRGPLSPPVMCLKMLAEEDPE